jgi:four helix bundle protein
MWWYRVDHQSVLRCRLDMVPTKGAEMKTHHDLDAWKLSIELADLVYRVTREFPREERYGLTSQLRRAAVSVPTNIAEGAARESTKEFRRFLVIARGSLTELETLIIIASNADLLSNDARHDAITGFHLRNAANLSKDWGPPLPSGTHHGTQQIVGSTKVAILTKRGLRRSDHRSPITDHQSLITNHRSQTRPFNQPPSYSDRTTTRQTRRPW